MPTLQVFDRLNSAETAKIRSMPYDTYFGDMSFLTKEEKEERIALARDLEDAMMFLFYLVISQSDYSYMAAISSVEIKDAFRQRVMDTIANHAEISEDLRLQISQFVDDTCDTTFEHLIIISKLLESPEQDAEELETEEFYLSDDRARLLAEEESNSVFNYGDYNKAVMLGYRTKTWLTMNDAFVRKTHVPLNGKTIPITELFMVGNSMMRFPRDDEYGAGMKEIARCRCICRYNSCNLLTQFT